MTTVTIEQIQAKQSELASMIAQLLAAPTVVPTTIQIEETIELAPGEHYAGLTTKPDGTYCAVVLLPGTGTDLTWTKAKAWAEEQGGALPTRQEQALLFANCKPHLQPRWHWTSEEHEEDASYAWSCYFYHGLQRYDHKSYEGSAVAVRQITLAASPEVPARKPLAQVNRYCSAGMCLATDREHEADCSRAASPAAPAAPVVPLTEGRITAIANELAFGGGHCNVYELARAIEAAHGITGGSK